MEENTMTKRIVGISKKAYIISIILVISAVISFGFNMYQESGFIHGLFYCLTHNHLEIVSITEIIYQILDILIMVLNFVIFIICGLIFRGIIVDKTPFRKKTADRLKTLSILFIISAFFSCACTVMNFIFFPDYIEGYSVFRSGVSDIQHIFYAIVFFLITLICRYGCQLQIESDETL